MAERGVLTDDQVIQITTELADAFLHGTTPRQLDRAALADELDPSGVGAVFGSTNRRVLRALSGWVAGTFEVLIPAVSQPTQINRIKWGTNSGIRQIAFAIVNESALSDLNAFASLFAGSPNISQYFDVDVQPVANDTNELTYDPNEIIIPKTQALVAYSPTSNGATNIFWEVRASNR